jgi:hypothetical protein
MPKAPPAVPPRDGYGQKIFAGDAAATRANTVWPELEKRYREYARLIVDTFGEHEPRLFPAYAPGLAGSAIFPFEIEVSGESQYNSIISPTFEHSIQVSDTSITPEGLITLTGSCSGKVVDRVFDINSLEYTGDFNVEPTILDGRVCLPLSAVLSTVQYDFSGNCKFSHGVYGRVTPYFYNAGTGGWSSGTPTTNNVGAGKNTSWAQTSDTTPHNNTQWLSFDLAAPSTDGNFSFTFTMTPTSGLWTPTGSYNPLSMTEYQPDWDTLLQDSDRASIVACAAMWTFVGATLDDSGTIAACNADSGLITDSVSPSDAYQTIASQPREVYTGPLKKGAHWHWIPNDISQYSMAIVGAPRPEVDNGYFAMKGMSTTGGAMKLRVAYLVNFYSRKPQYRLDPRPPPFNFAYLLYLLKTEVPCVTSNESHLKKVKAAISSVARVVRRIATDPLFLQVLEAGAQLAL